MTWTSNCDSRVQRQLEHWITNSIELVQDAKVSKLGVDSNHNAVIMKVNIPSKKKRRKDTESVPCHQILQNKEIKEQYNKCANNTYKKNMGKKKNTPGPNSR